MTDQGGPRIRRREIEERDFVGVVDLLGRGFPGRPRRYWERGLGRMGERPALPGCPRYGVLLEADGAVVGVALTLFSAPARGGPADGSAGDAGGVRCNLSSWTVDPAYRMQASLLVAALLKRRDVTFTNISPAPHTWATIEAQGFRPYATGQALVAPILARRGPPARVSAEPASWRGLPEAALLDDHRGYGCTCLAVAAADGVHPFVFLPFRARSGRLPLPLMQLVYARGPADFARFARPLGLWLLARGALGVMVDDDGRGEPHGEPYGEPGGPPVLRRFRRGRKYAKGPHVPRLGDLSYTERVIFGP